MASTDYVDVGITKDLISRYRQTHETWLAFLRWKLMMSRTLDIGIPEIISKVLWKTD